MPPQPLVPVRERESYLVENRFPEIGKAVAREVHQDSRLGLESSGSQRDAHTKCVALTKTNETHFKESSSGNYSRVHAHAVGRFFHHHCGTG
jgi:hypothetical protein